VGTLEQMFGQDQKTSGNLPNAAEKPLHVVEKQRPAIEKQHPAVGAEEGEPLKNCSRQPQKSGRDLGSGEELGPRSPPEALCLEKCVVEPHAYDYKTTKRSHQVKA
jgi:hypothetical protein